MVVGAVLECIFASLLPTKFGHLLFVCLFDLELNLIDGLKSKWQEKTQEALPFLIFSGNHVKEGRWY